MLPQYSLEDTTAPPTRTIFINPNFNKVRQQQSNGAAVAAAVTTAASSSAHFNPLFLHANRPPAIHMNPQFLRKKLLEQEQMQLQRLRLLSQVKQLEPACGNEPNPAAITVSAVDTDRKIIVKSRTHIVREPALVEAAAMVVDKTTPQRVTPFITLSRRKLVRRIAGAATEKSKSIEVSPPMPAGIAPAKTASVSGKYKIDNRRKGDAVDKTALALSKTRRRAFVARYALRRSSDAESLTSKRRASLSSGNAVVKTRFKFQARNASKNLQLLNINGVLYRSTRNKLQRKDTATVPATLPLPDTAGIKAKVTAKLPHGRTLFVRGTKFVMDQQSFKLTRVPAAMPPNVSEVVTDTRPATTRQRIDIGGLTYIASKTQNVYVRTRNHLTLAHLNTAKQRSLQLLMRRLVKSNVPCAIFQRVGKCVAHERDKCNKVHDKLQVAVCPRFLRSECHNRECLLSHNVSLSKMPVCKFFLQGVCVRPDCPYLHKKLSPSAGICEDFVRGFCMRAAQCNKRHEFLCPEFARSGKCTLTNCAHCKSRKRQRRLKKDVKETNSKKVATASVGSDESLDVGSAVLLPLRYFSGATAKEQSIEATASDLDFEGAPAVVEEQTDDDLSTTSTSSRPRRPKVGALPAFIPLS